MHEMKARVYDTKTGQMYPVVCMDWFVGKGEVCSVTVICDDERFPRRFSYDPNRFKLMWWTGTYDKNGAEIWEGDVFRDDPDPLTVIMFEAGAWYAGDIELYNCYEDGTVVGNIYQNPELLPSRPQDATQDIGGVSGQGGAQEGKTGQESGSMRELNGG